MFSCLTAQQWAELLLSSARKKLSPHWTPCKGRDPGSVIVFILNLFVIILISQKYIWSYSSQVHLFFLIITFCSCVICLYSPFNFSYFIVGLYRLIINTSTYCFHDWPIDHLVSEMSNCIVSIVRNAPHSGGSEVYKCLFLVQPRVQNPKSLNLPSYMTNKNSKSYI